jgi:hypothetical protein
MQLGSRVRISYHNLIFKVQPFKPSVHGSLTVFFHQLYASNEIAGQKK